MKRKQWSKKKYKQNVDKTANSRRVTGIQESIMSRFFRHNGTNANILIRGMQNFGQSLFATIP